MKKTSLSNGIVLLEADKDCVLRRIDSDPHTEIKKIAVLAKDVPNIEEVPIEVVPPYTKAQYDEKVASFVRERYSESEEFAIQRKMLNALIQPAPLNKDKTEMAIVEYSAYNSYVEECKERAKDAKLYEGESV